MTRRGALGQQRPQEVVRKLQHFAQVYQLAPVKATGRDLSGASAALGRDQSDSSRTPGKASAINADLGHHLPVLRYDMVLRRHRMPDLKLLYILVLALLPGALGDWAYRMLIGVRWKEDQWRFALRTLGFSILGLVLYSFATLAGAPAPTYIFPNLFASIVPATLPTAAAAYLGHCIAGALVGILAAQGVRVSARLLGASGYPCAWDDFVRKGAPGHMVIVTLENGDAYAGVLQVCDVSVERDERDIVLSEPALYDEERKDYFALSFNRLFIPANLRYSIATVTDPEHDKRTVPIGESPFTFKEQINEQSKTASA